MRHNRQTSWLIRASGICAASLLLLVLDLGAVVGTTAASISSFGSSHLMVINVELGVVALGGVCFLAGGALLAFILLRQTQASTLQALDLAA